MKIVARFLLVCLLACFCSISAFAHSGRTDSSGGHKDNQNASGLGSYHYHHGYGPHLHENGICPYSPKDTINITNQPTSMIVGESVDLVYEITYYSGNSNVQFISSDESVISVNNGSLRALNKGTATITAQMHNGVKIFNITVNEIEVSEILINNIVETLAVNEVLQISYLINPNDATNKNVSFTSSNEEVLIINENAEMTGLKEGISTVTITAENGVKKSFDIEIKKVEVSEINILNTETEMMIGEEYTLRADVLPLNATNKEILWGTSDSSIAIIDSDGKITLSNEGEVTFTATCSSVSSSININIVNADEEITVETMSTSIDETQESDSVFGLIGVAALGGLGLNLYRKKKT